MAASRNIFDALLDSYNRIQNYCDDVWKNGLIGTFVNRCFIILFRKELQLIVLELLTIRFDIIWLLSVSMLDKWSIFLRMKIFLWMNDPFFEGVFLVITPTIFNSEARNLSNRNLDQFWQLNISNPIVYKFLIPLSF